MTQTSVRKGALRLSCSFAVCREESLLGRRVLYLMDRKYRRTNVLFHDRFTLIKASNSQVERAVSRVAERSGCARAGHTEESRRSCGH